MAEESKIKARDIKEYVSKIKKNYKVKIKNLQMMAEGKAIENQSQKQRIVNLENQLEVFFESQLSKTFDREKIMQLREQAMGEGGEKEVAEKVDHETIVKQLDTNQIMIDKEKQIHELIQNEVTQKEFYEKKIKEQSEFIQIQNSTVKEHKGTIKQQRKVQGILDDVSKENEKAKEVGGKLQRELEEKDSQVEEQQGKIEELKSQNTRQEEQLLKNQEALLELSSQVQMLEQENDKITGQIKLICVGEDDDQSLGASTKIDMIGTQLEQRELMIDQLQDSLGMMREGQQVLQTQKAELESQLKQVKEEFNAQTDQLLVQEQSLQEAGSQKGGLEEERESLKTSLERESEVNGQLKRQMEEQMRLIQSSSTIQAQQKMANQQLMQQNAELVIKMQREEFDEDDQSDMTGSIGGSTQMDAIQTQLDQKDVMIENMHNTALMLRKRNQELEDEVAALKG